MSTKQPSGYYPNIAQSLGITGLIILLMMVLAPLYLMLHKVLGQAASILIYYVVAMGASFGIIYKQQKKRGGRIAVRFKNHRRIPWLIIATAALLFGIAHPLSSLIPIPEAARSLFVQFDRLNGTYGFIFLVIAAPVFEELIFRGIILEGFLKNHTPQKSILISSFLFGFIHLNPWQFVIGFIFGLFIGWIYFRTRSLYFAMMIHATVNLLVFLMSAIMPEERQNIIQEYGGSANFILIIAGCIVTLGCCIWYLNKVLNHTTKLGY